MSSTLSPQVALDDLAALPRGDDLARLVHTVAFAAADERRTSLSDGLAELLERSGLSAADAETGFGNVVRALERGGGEAAGSATRLLLSATLARGVALSPPLGAEAEGRVAETLVWLAANSSVDALAALDAALGQGAEGLWVAVAAIVRKADEGRAPLLGRAGALIAAAALRSSASPAAQAEAKALADEARDPIVRSLLGAPPSPAAGPVSATSATGEVVGAPRGPLALVLLAACGALAVMYVLRLVARVALRYRRPAELRVTPRGVTLLARTELLGRTLRQSEVHIPVESLARASREVRYPRLALYTGLFSLAMGSYCGLTLFINGARAGSPELLGLGALVVALGIGLDFALENVATTRPGRCRVVFVPREGRTLAVGGLDPVLADAALARLRGA